jgi:glycosyltransferase involved in cell wall biosynthesis
MKILYLYAEVMGYTMATIRALSARGVQVHLVHWDHRRLTPFVVEPLSDVIMYKRSGLSTPAMIALAGKIRPSVIVVSGWMDEGYTTVAKKFRSAGVPVVVALDSQWQGTFRQRFATFIGYIGHFGRIYSHAWVAGSYQFEYVRRLGFDKSMIVYDLLCADLLLFNKAFTDNIAAKRSHYPHRFLFVGRFEPIKGLNVLLRAWKMLGCQRRDWELHVIGSGSLRSEMESCPGVVVKDFMQPEGLLREVAGAGCFLLPSQNEPWGVVVHEFAASGLPLIVSDVVGSASTFLIPGFNGFRFKVNDSLELSQVMLKFIDMYDAEIQLMAVRSHTLGQRITPETSAANLLSIVSQ